MEFLNVLGVGRSLSGGFADKEGSGLIRGIKFLNALGAGRSLCGDFGDNYSLI